MLGFFCNFLDRVNVGMAAPTINPDLKFSNAVFDFGAGLFFLGYFLAASRRAHRKVRGGGHDATVGAPWTFLSINGNSADAMARTGPRPSSRKPTGEGSTRNGDAERGAEDA
jgi:hypothetical protein